MYKLSRSTMKRIVKQISWGKIFENKSSSSFDVHRLKRDDVKQLAKSYLLPPSGPKSIPMTVKHVKAELKELYPIQKMRNFVKTEMKYTYK